ncbi:MAG: hypothetical protein P8R54_13970 [Myxococcota bacterium]|nr:hypothetical protein [Myxococcota bacterium]
MLLGLLVGMDASACASVMTPMVRVCVESVTRETAVRWTVEADWPPVEVWTEDVSISTVRILPSREPSWMWERPLLNPPQPFGVRFELVSHSLGGMPTAPGAVLYVDADTLSIQVDELDLSAPRFIMDRCDGRLNVRQVKGTVYELELCPELQQALAQQ